MKIKKKPITVILSIICVAALAVGSLAFFTDRIDSTATATAGTLNLDFTGITTSKTTDFKPSEGITLDYTLSNAGSKSADVLEVLVLSSNKAMTEGANPAEFEIYNASDVTLVNGVATIHDSATPLAVRSMSADKKQITYALPQFILNGTGTDAEIEEGITETSKTASYVLVFNKAAGNTYQETELTLYYEAQAKQHRNTNNDTWNTIKSETISFAGNDSHAAVPSMSN